MVNLRSMMLAFLALTPVCLVVPTAAVAAQTQSDGGTCAAWLDHRIGKLHSDLELDLCALTAGHPVLLVNTASFCGYTPQFKGLEALYQQYRDKGLVIVGFPSDDFFQESGDAAETADVCYINYGVTFPMTAEIKVRGKNAHPIFRHLQSAGSPSWNFNKYLIGRDGEIIEHFGSSVKPDSSRLLAEIELAL